MNMENSLNHLFSTVTNQFWIELERSMNEIDLHSGQIFVLILLWETDEQTQIEIARKLNLSAQTVNKMVKSLNGKGFVKTRRSKNDARKVKVFLTEKGARVKSLAEKQWESLETRFFASLSETEKLILRQIFEKLKEQLMPKVADEKSSQ
jgi:MarR family transcriptional regulator, organic hydroperoxide resistance regulator